MASGAWLRPMLAAVVLIVVAACSPGGGGGAAGGGEAPGANRMTAFGTAEELRGFLQTRVRPRSRWADSAQSSDATTAAPSPAPAAAPPAAAAEGESITNVQTEGVDEGGIVKTHGDHLVVLRRGRIFTVSVAGGRMQPVDQIDVTPPGVRDAGAAWYDEMLIAGDHVVVIGYSYGRGTSDLYRFRIGRDGRLTRLDAYQLKSADYYSSRNYASRLIGTRLVLYSPMPLTREGDVMAQMPAMRSFRDDDSEAGFRPIADVTKIYVPAVLRNDPKAVIDTLHTVTECDLAAARLDCTATGVLGASSRVFYVGQRAVYLWISDAFEAETEEQRRNAILYRLPLGDERPSAIGVRGAPVDQFSFREDARDGILNVLVRSSGGGDTMWQSEFTAGKVALLRLPVGDMTAADQADPARYRFLPGDIPAWNFRNRFVGDYVLYGSGEAGRRDPGEPTLVAAPLRGGEATMLATRTGVDRIEVLGADALVVGADNSDLIFTSVELGRGTPRIGDEYVYRNASEGENRSHAFFFRPDPASPDGANGLMGLPVAKAGSSQYQSLTRTSAALVFLRRTDRRFAPLGELDARNSSVVDDNCVASCSDWYGNARPIFLRGRIFALLGYELVEGAVDGQRIREVGRVSFSPGRRTGREEPKS